MGPGSASAFDEHAPRYDARAGLPATVGITVARAIVDCAAAGADDLVAEIGASTGEIGVHLSRLPLRYVGFDSSPAVLDVFRAKANDASPSLIVADCNRAWPLPDDAATNATTLTPS